MDARSCRSASHHHGLDGLPDGLRHLAPSSSLSLLLYQTPALLPDPPPPHPTPRDGGGLTLPELESEPAGQTLNGRQHERVREGIGRCWWLNAAVTTKHLNARVHGCTCARVHGCTGARVQVQPAA